MKEKIKIRELILGTDDTVDRSFTLLDTEEKRNALYEAIAYTACIYNQDEPQFAHLIYVSLPFRIGGSSGV